MKPKLRIRQLLVVPLLCVGARSAGAGASPTPDVSPKNRSSIGAIAANPQGAAAYFGGARAYFAKGDYDNTGINQDGSVVVGQRRLDFVSARKRHLADNRPQRLLIGNWQSN